MLRKLRTHRFEPFNEQPSPFELTTSPQLRRICARNELERRPDGSPHGRLSPALLLVSVIPSVVGWAGAVYVLKAAELGIGCVTWAVGFLHAQSVARTRRLLWASLIYLPALLTLLIVQVVF
jgi:hypothetical protein